MGEAIDREEDRQAITERVELAIDEERRQRVLRPYAYAMLITIIAIPLVVTIIVAVQGVTNGTIGLSAGTIIPLYLTIELLMGIPCLMIFGSLYEQRLRDGRSQKICLCPGKLLYAPGAKTGEEDVVRTYWQATAIDRYQLKKSYILVYGDFERVPDNRTHDPEKEPEKLESVMIMRTVEDEEKLIALLNSLLPVKTPEEVAAAAEASKDGGKKKSRRGKRQKKEKAGASKD